MSQLTQVVCNTAKKENTKSFQFICFYLFVLFVHQIFGPDLTQKLTFPSSPINKYSPSVPSPNVTGNVNVELNSRVSRLEKFPH